MANITICLYGDSGTFKTTQVGFLSKMIYEKYGKVTRLVSADGGGYRPLEPYIQAGLIEAYSVIDEDKIIYILHQLTQGYWPMELKNGKRVGSKFTRNLDNVGMYAFEGLTTISERIIDHLAGKKLGMNPAYSMKLTSSGETISTSDKGDFKDQKFLSEDKLVDDKGNALGDVISGAYSQDHYGYVQKTVVEKVLMSWNLPVELVLWTSHEAKGEDENTRASIYGPALVGKKGTPKIPRNVGMLIHADIVEDERKPPVAGDKTTDSGIASVRYYFTSHPDKAASKIIWNAKPRIPSDLIPELMKRFQGGFFVPKVNEGLDMYLKVEDELIAKQANSLSEWKQKIDNERNK